MNQQMVTFGVLVGLLVKYFPADLAVPLATDIMNGGYYSDPELLSRALETAGLGKLRTIVFMKHYTDIMMAMPPILVDDSCSVLSIEPSLN